MNNQVLEEVESFDIYEPEKAGKLGDIVPTITMMIGLPASGKTTFAKELMSHDTIYISSDEIREELGDINDMSKNKEVFAIFEERFKAAVLAGKDIILDATHSKKEYRKKYIDFGEKHNYFIIGAYMNIDYEEAWSRNNSRERIVPKDVIRKMFFELEEPLYSEGFNDIIYIDKGGNIKSI